MAKDKLLAEWFWTDRWDGSSAMLLPIEARGLYREMLTQAWRRGAKLPNDHEAIKRATRVTAREWTRCWPQVASYWRVDGHSLVNDTQLEIYAAAKAMSDRASERGLRGAQARHGHSSGSTQARAQASPEDKPPSPSPRKTESIQPPTVGRANPLLADRPKLEIEALALVRRMVELTGEDPLDVIARASGYDGAKRTKVNPATMSDDRLINTVRDLRADVAAEERKRGAAQQ
jgi:uncharacterized protein YdaU (DUF1376 family)